MPEDAVLRLPPEEQAEKVRTKKREYERRKFGRVSRAEYLAKLAAARAEKARAKEAEKLAKIRERAIEAARKAEERQARKEAKRWQQVTRPRGGTTHGNGVQSRSVRKPGRITAMCGWMGW